MLGLLIFALLLPLAVAAVEPDEILDDPALEQRAREISKELRCLVCQNQSIDDSNADLAKELRLIVRERLVAGDSDEEVIAFMTSRYGDWVLLRPPFNPRTWALWIGPAVVFAAAAAGAAVYIRQRGRAKADGDVPPLTDAEKRRIAALTGDETRDGTDA
jgi:cytochrome c-type biogenesis protein CcmH